MFSFQIGTWDVSTRNPKTAHLTFPPETTLCRTLPVKNALPPVLIWTNHTPPLKRSYVFVPMAPIPNMAKPPVKTCVTQYAQARAHVMTRHTSGYIQLKMQLESLEYMVHRLDGYCRKLNSRLLVEKVKKENKRSFFHYYWWFCHTLSRCFSRFCHASRSCYFSRFCHI